MGSKLWHTWWPQSIHIIIARWRFEKGFKKGKRAMNGHGLIKWWPPSFYWRKKPKWSWYGIYVIVNDNNGRWKDPCHFPLYLHPPARARDRNRMSKSKKREVSWAELRKDWLKTGAPAFPISTTLLWWSRFHNKHSTAATTVYSYSSLSILNSKKGMGVDYHFKFYFYQTNHLSFS